MRTSIVLAALGALLASTVPSGHSATAQERTQGSLSQLAPTSLEGWRKAAQYPADQIGLDAHPGAVDGVLVEFTKPLPAGSMATYHDLFIDIYRYKSKADAAEVVAEPPISYGELSRDTILDQPVMLVRHRSDEGNTADAWVVFQRGDVTVEINAAMGGAESVPLSPLVDEVRSATRVVLQLMDR